MTLNFYTLGVLYLVYSFLGWVGETVVATFRGKRFANRGMAAGPFCFVYGTTAILMAVGFADMRTKPVVLFVACMLTATVVEWLTAKLLERLHNRKWWDYSDKKFNLNGYVCLQYSVLWGALGMVTVLWGNGLLLRLCALVPDWLLHPLVWGPFSVVWGLALAMATVLLRQNQEKSDRYLFAFGTVLGGVYEYVCSAVTELLFGTVFWDYSKFKFNLGGRINLLYCFFWGIAAVLWMRYGYPLVLKLMKKVRSHIRPWMTAMLAVFMAVNMLTSALALARYDARTSGEAPNGQLEVFLDEHFDNARMERIYPNAKKVIKAE